MVVEGYNEMGIIYGRLGDFETAERYLLKAQQSFGNVLVDEPLQGDILMNFGILSDMSGAADSALFYYGEARALFEKQNLRNKQVQVNNNLGSLFLDLGNYQEALQAFSRVESLLDPTDAPSELAFLSIKLGRTNAGLNQWDEAIFYLNRGANLSQRNDQPYLLGEALEYLKDAYAKAGKFENAYRTSLSYDSLVLVLEENKAIELAQELEAKYQNKAKQQRIAYLKKQDVAQKKIVQRQEYLIFAAAVALVLLITTAYFFRAQSIERKKRVDQLRELDRVKTNFLSHIAHEIRTPLALISAPLQSLRAQIRERGANRDDVLLQGIQNNSRKLNHLVEELLDLSKLDEKGLSKEESTVQLRDFLLRVTGAYETLADQKEINYEVTVSEELNTLVISDFGKIEKCLDNLISNALKFTPKGGEVQFDAVQTSNGFCVTVRDNGPGIAPEEHDQVFKRFYRTKQGAKNEGTGIGLSLVAEYIALLEGTLSLKSDLNQGATFTLGFSVKEVDATVHAHYTSESSVISFEEPKIDLEVNDEKPHVLLVEDHPEMSRYMRSLLQSEYRVSVAHDGVEAWTMFLKYSFDLVFTDVMIPEFDGFELVQRIRSNEQGKQVPVIMITARALTEDRVRGFELGVDDYITKPFHPDELIARAKHLIKYASVRSSSELEEENPLTADEQLVRSAQELIEENIAVADFGVQQIADALNMSDRNLQRILKRETGLTTIQVIREVRLQRAYSLLQNQKMKTVAEVAFSIGMENPSYFSKLFRERFGIRPNELSL